VASERQDGVFVEQIWVIEAAYAPDAAERRPAVRPAHLARILELMAAGVMIEAGAFADMSGSLLFVRAATEEDALALARADVYWAAGVWTSVKARRFGRVVPAD
jgi:uncharacterized protein YciI